MRKYLKGQHVPYDDRTDWQDENRKLRVQMKRLNDKIYGQRCLFNEIHEAAALIEDEGIRNNILTLAKKGATHEPRLKGTDKRIP